MTRLQRIAGRTRQLPAQTVSIIVDRDVPRDRRLGQRGQHGVAKATTRRWLDRRSAVLMPDYGEHVVVAGPGDRDAAMLVRQRSMLDGIRSHLMQRHADALRGFPSQPQLGAFDGNTSPYCIGKV